MNHVFRVLVLGAAAALAACGTTSDIKPTRTAEAAGAAAPAKQGSAIDLSAYDRVVVLDFVDGTDKAKLSPDKVREYSETVARATRTFPDIIAQRVRATGAFAEVSREATPGKALVVSGRITRLVEGSGALRLWIGMGAGSSYFDATTDLADAESGRSLGQISTEKNSWALGGAIAATQTVESFMDGAADKIATKLRDGKRAAVAGKAK